MTFRFTAIGSRPLLSGAYMFIIENGETTMQLTINGKQIDLGDALRTHVEDTLTTLTEKYFNSAIEGTVFFSKDAYLYKCAIKIHAGRGIELSATAEANEPYPAFEQAAERLGKRLRRYKSKLQDHHARIKETPEFTVPKKIFAGDREENSESEGQEPVIVAEMQAHIDTMTVSDAVMRLELGELPALLFRNSSHDGLNMVYRRPDGNVGWVDPVEAKGA